jgi:hypothetical protein
MDTFRVAGPFVLAAVLAGGGPIGASGDPASGVDRLPRSRILAAAREIDRLVEADLAAHGLTANPVTDDAAFVRRAHLDLIGRIPTSEETSAFLAASEPDKREALVDRLLGSPGYGSHLFNWLADLLRVKSRLQNQVSGEPYIHFIKESLARNKPWDVFVREMLTASGNAHKRGNGATGYFLRDRGMVEDNMSNTITIFLGTRLECAQCHNHPFDKWKQLQYHEMVAFTGGMRFTDDSLRASEEGKRLEALGAAYRGQGREAGRSLEYRAFQRVLQPLQYGISGSGTGLYRLPKDYQYDDGKANQVVKARAMFGAEVELKADPAEADRGSGKPGRNGRAPAIRAAEINSREAYARWLTSADNPRFAQVIANRMWKRLFGAGVIEPVDNLKDSTKAVNEPLLKHLEKTLVELGFDLKQYLRVLAYSRTYQREASRKEASDEEPYRFPGPLLRRMSAEQLWDSMVTLVVPGVDGTLLKPGEAAEPVYAEYERLLGISEAEVKRRVEAEALRQKDPAKFRELQRAQEAKARELRDAQKTLQDSLAAARKKGDEAAVRKLEGELKAVEADPAFAALMRPGPGYRRGRDNRPALARASDLQQPAPPGHFLREFGQSDREQIEASHTQSAVPQALSLLNGFVDKTLLPNKASAVRAAAAAARSPSEKVRAVFLSIVNRPPEPKERESWVPDVEKRGDAALGDLIWTLVNTHEFMFIR